MCPSRGCGRGRSPPADPPHTKAQAWGCSLYKKSCDFLLPFNLFGAEPNRLQIKELLKNKFIDFGKHRISIADDGGIEKIEIENSNSFSVDNEEDDD